MTEFQRRSIPSYPFSIMITSLKKGNKTLKPTTTMKFTRNWCDVFGMKERWKNLINFHLRLPLPYRRIFIISMFVSSLSPQLVKQASSLPSFCMSNLLDLNEASLNLNHVYQSSPIFKRSTSICELKSTRRNQARVQFKTINICSLSIV